MPEASLRILRDPMVLMAFGGWSDAAQAATDTAEHLITTYSSEVVVSMDPSDFYDFQSSRPVAGIDPFGERTITWPTTEVIITRMPHRDLVVVRGMEPNFRWPAYAAALTATLTLAEPELVVVLGAMLAEIPHTRPVPVSTFSSSRELRQRYDAESPSYEGPTGIQGVMAQATHNAKMPTLSVWAACSHYVANPPNPKATLAMLTRLEDLLGPVDLGDLPARSDAWERSVDELAAEDPDMTDYIQSLEAASDAEVPEPSGEEIAAEFQRYLRRRGAP